MEPTNTDGPPKPSIRPPAAKLAREHHYPAARVRRIQFGLLSNRDVARLSVLAEKDAGNRRVGITKGAGLFDARLGVPNKEQKCKTCNGTRRGAFDRADSCDGHFGHIDLPAHIYHPHFIRKCLKTLSSICLGCSRVLEKKRRRNVLEGIFEEVSCDEDGESENSALEKPARKRKAVPGTSKKRKRAEKSKESDFAKLLMQDLDCPVMKEEWEPSFAMDSSNLEFPQVCKLEPTEVSDAALPGCVPESPSRLVPGMPRPPNAGQPLVCNHCSGRDGLGSKFPKIKVKFFSKIVQRKGKVDTIKLVVDEKAGDLPTGFWDFVDGFPTNYDEKIRPLLPCEAYKILKRIPRDDIGKLQMDLCVASPESFVIKNTLVSPNCNRLVMEDWNSTLQPRVLQRRSGPTSKLEALVRKAKQIKDTTFPNPLFEDAEQDSEELQLLAARHFRACKVFEYKMTTGQEVEETGGTLELKWLKANVLAKRSNYSARSVINGDPCIRIEEIGIPKEIALRLTVDEKVNTLNILGWQKFVDAYMVSDNGSMPGAFILKKKEAAYQRDLELLRTTTQNLSIKLAVGDTIIRCLKDGDRVFVNRPPSLHKHSLVTLKVKVHSLSTIAINPLICPPFDADFDGDAFHVFVPQALESKAETQELMTIPAQMISSQGGQPLIGLTQDSLVAAHLLTSGHVFINRRDMQQLSMWCSSGVPVPAIVKASARTGPLWTGKQLYSMTMPNGLSFGSLSWTGTPLGMTVPPKRINGPEGDVLIQDGEVLICQGGAKWLDRSPNGVVRAVCDHAGPVATMQHLDCLQAVLHQWLLIRGFSVGLLDYYAAEDAGARRRMLNGVQRSLEKSNEASLKQALRLDRQVQHRILFPKQREHGAIAGDADDVEEHQGCFGLLLGDKKSTPRVAVLQGAAVERFQALSLDIENLVSGYMDKKNSLLAMVRSGSKGSMSKLTQQVGCLGLQLYKGERILPVRRNNKLTYFQTSLENGKSDVFYQTKADAGLEGYWESRGIIRNSYLDGLTVRELFIDTISSRCNVLREGIEEPNQILKNLMLFMRDMKIEYDGTVRIGSGQSIIQFQYGTNKGCPLDIDPSPPAPLCGSSNPSLVSEEPEDHWPNSKLAGEPVGVLAATSIAEPAYNVKMQSIHQAQVLGTGPVQLLKEILMVRSKTKLKLNDRRSILRLPDGFGKERRALEIQRHLQKISLEKITLTCAIEHWKLDNKLYVKDEIDKPFMRMSTWTGHIQLCKKTVDDNKIDIHSIVEILNKKHSGKSTEDLHGIYFSYSRNCISRVHPRSEDLCVWFFPVIPPEVVATTDREFYPEKMSLLLESMRTTMLPAILKTTIRGSDNIEKVRIFWEDSGSASRLPVESTSQGCQHSVNQAKRADPGELAIEVVVKAPKGAGKRGAAWLSVKEACVSVMDMIDWRRSTPYAIQEICKGYGVEAARHIILKRLALAGKNMGKPIHQEHMMLVADTMTHCGDVTGLGSAGYRDFCQHLSISAPFTEAAFQQPKKTFLDAAAGGASESIDGVLTSAVWGLRVPLGTGIAFQVKPKVPKITSQKWPGDPLDIWEELREPKVVPRKKSADSKVSHFEKSLFQKGKQKGSMLAMLEDLEDLTGTRIFQDGKLAGIMLGKDFTRATILQYDNQGGCDEDMPENVQDVTTGPAILNAFPDGQQAKYECAQERMKETKGATILEDGKHEVCDGTVERVGDGTGAPTIEGYERTGCKRVLERPEGEEMSDKPVSKVLKKHATTPGEGDIAILRVNDPRRVTWSGCADGEAIAAEDRKVNCIYDSYKLPHFSSEEVSEENITPTTDARSEEDIAAASVKGATSSVAGRASLNSTDFSKIEAAGGALSSVPSSRGLFSGGMTNIVKTAFRRVLGALPGKNDQDTLEQEMKGPPCGSDLRKGNQDIAGCVSQSTREVLLKSRDQSNTHLSSVKYGTSLGRMQSEVVANNEYEQLIIDEKKELQNLLHYRYRIGERVQGDDEKMIVEEVLAHHPRREEKIGCGVAYVKVDHHPDHPASKCFHIVRTDGSWTDFSYLKCLDRKLLKLCNSKQK